MEIELIGNGEPIFFEKLGFKRTYKAANLDAAQTFKKMFDGKFFRYANHWYILI